MDKKASFFKLRVKVTFGFYSVFSRLWALWRSFSCGFWAKEFTQNCVLGETIPMNWCNNREIIMIFSCNCRLGDSITRKWCSVLLCCNWKPDDAIIGKWLSSFSVIVGWVMQFQSYMLIARSGVGVHEEARVRTLVVLWLMTISDWLFDWLIDWLMESFTMIQWQSLIDFTLIIHNLLNN